MTNQGKRWEILNKTPMKNIDSIISALLKNRGIKTERDKKEFFNPVSPMKISLKSIGIKESEVKKAVNRIKKAKKDGESVIIYGDYDADGITGTATMWEALHAIGLNVLPYIPERFSEGYGLNLESVRKLKEKDPKLGLIITVDHGITAGKKVEELKKMGIDMIISDHHQKGKEITRPLALIYTDKVGGSALAWFFAREVAKQLKISKFNIAERLQLAAIGTVADQLPLLGPNRSIVKYGLDELSSTKRPGLLALFEEARIDKEKVGTYEIGFVIAPRINSMGRLKHGLESLRLLCTTNKLKALEIAKNIGSTNTERQRIVDEVVISVRERMNKYGADRVIVIADEHYHEGVIGLAAAKLVEEFYRPAIVLSKKGDIAKASARSVSGFNIIEVIRQLEHLYIEGGGHPMAAGFSIETANIEKFAKELNKLAKPLLTDEVLSRRLKIDVEINFDELDFSLLEKILEFEPTGLGNPTPTFMTPQVDVIDAKLVGRESKHLKLRLRKDEHIFDSIYFGGGEIYSSLTPDSKIDVVYQLEEDSWNGNKSLQLKIRDVHLLD